MDSDCGCRTVRIAAHRLFGECRNGAGRGGEREGRPARRRLRPEINAEAPNPQDAPPAGPARGREAGTCRAAALAVQSNESAPDAPRLRRRVCSSRMHPRPFETQRNRRRRGALRDRSVNRGRPTVTSSLDLYPSVTERYNVLLDLARTLTSTLVPSALYAALHQHVARVLPTNAFSVAVVNRAGEARTVFHAGEGAGAPPLGGVELEHLREGDFVLRGAAGDASALLAAPLTREGRLIGYLAAQRREARPFDATDANFLLAVGQLAAVAVDNA